MLGADFLWQTLNFCQIPLVVVEFISQISDDLVNFPHEFHFFFIYCHIQFYYNFYLDSAGTGWLHPWY